MDKQIVFFVHRFPQVSETFIVGQIKCAKQLGYNVTVLSQKQPENNEIINNLKENQSFNVQYSLAFPSNKFVRLFKAVFYILKLGLPPKYFFRSINFTKYGNRGRSLYYFFHAISFYKLPTSTIIHAQFGDNGAIMAVLKSIGMLKGKLITTFHGWDLHFDNKTIEQLKNEYKLLFQIGDVFTVNTPYLMEKLLALGCPVEKVIVLPMGADADFFSPLAIKDTKDYIQLISVGRLIELKGHKLGIDVVKILVDKGFNLKYYIVGDGESRADLEEQVKQLNLQKSVYILGSQSQQNIRDLLQQSDIFLMTSVADKHGRREAQGLVTIEAQLCGLPVVAFDSGGVKYTIHNNKTGFLVDENAVNQMAEKVSMLINSVELRTSFGLNSRIFAKDNYSLQITENILMQVYGKFL